MTGWAIFNLFHKFGVNVNINTSVKYLFKDSAEKPTNSPEETNNIFRSFYTSLYSLDKDWSQEDIN